MSIRPPLLIIAGAVLSAGVGYVWAGTQDDALARALEQNADAALAQAGLAQITVDTGLSRRPTRHVLLDGADALDEADRARAARLVGGISGVGGVIWADGTMQAEGEAQTYAPMHCEDEVGALLRARSIRFEESSAEIEAASRELLDEVAQALRPCLGSVISVTGHTDKSGPEPGNLALSLDRARAIREALVARGIPRDGLRASGVGSRRPVEGLAPGDPANRRIEFSVISTVPVTPTIVDTPGAR